MGLTLPFAANGVEFNNERNILFVADTRVSSDHPDPGPDGSAGTAKILVTGINAPDGIMIDRDDNIWICSNREDEIVVIDKKGKVIAKLGGFGGIDENGIARELLFPASLAFSNDGSTLYVSNLTLYLPSAGPLSLIETGESWGLDVDYTVAARADCHALAIDATRTAPPPVRSDSGIARAGGAT
jgi:sugar lactone lactonase YvrE